MKTRPRFNLLPNATQVLLLLSCGLLPARGEDTNGTALLEPRQTFASNTIDVGLVVSDITKALKFYTEAIGFEQVESVKLPAGFTAQSGLTRGRDLDIKILALGKGENATRLKLAHVPGVNSKRTDNTYVYSQLGFSYITIYVTDIDHSLDRLVKAEGKLVSRGIVRLPKGFPDGLYMIVAADPDGNRIELIGPRGNRKK